MKKIPASVLLLLEALLIDFGASFQLASSAYHDTPRRQNQCDLKNISYLHAARPIKDDPSASSAGAAKAGLIFPGGGLFFYWQAGVIVSTSILLFLLSI
jgi:hypothetical protein